VIKIFWRLFFLTLSFTVSAFAYPNFEDNPYLDTKMRSLIAPHLLPLDHPAKPLLDLIFSQSRVVENKKSLLDAGFIILAEMPTSYVIVAKHPSIPGYVFKLYLDSEKRCKRKIPSWQWLTRRCQGAKKIREIIQKKKLRYFIVPDKWLYILPLYPLSQESNPQPIILIETEMELYHNSKLAWKTFIKPKHLDELYTILKSGYGSTHLDVNVPYTLRRKFVFIDTESPKRSPNLTRVKKYLSSDMQNYWDTLIHITPLKGFENDSRLDPL
jgi:hypothetical protein